MQQFIQYQSDKFNALTESLENKIKELQREQEIASKLNKRSAELLEPIEQMLNEMNLTISNWIPSMTSNLIQISAEPTNSKFKFYKLTGYDREGRSTNHRRRRAKAEKLSEKMNIKIEDVKFSINEFSLETHSNTISPSVLITAHYKI